MQKSRQQLYDQVWSKPIRQLAKEYSLSGVGLSKLCRRHNIPLPPMGYWMKVSHGIYPRKPPLPPVESGQSEIIEIVDKESDTFDPAKYPDLFKEYSAIKREGLKLKFPSSTEDLHPLLQNSLKHLKRARSENNSRLSPGRQNCAHIRVSPNTVDRALKIMHALFDLFESQGFAVSVGDYKDAGTCVKILGESLCISLKEKVKRSELVQTSPFGRKCEFHPLGVLIFETEDYYAPEVRHAWQDTPSSPLEEKLFEISEGLIDIAVRWKVRRMERESEQQQRAEESDLQKAEEQIRKDEQVRFERLLKDAKDWQNSQTVRLYINAVRASVKCDETPEAKAKLERWIEWAEPKADELDPERNWKA